LKGQKLLKLKIMVRRIGKVSENEEKGFGGK
jgi:hypothetical protein